MAYRDKNAGNWFKTDPTLKTPESVTHESMANGWKQRSVFRIKRKKQLNFQSFPMQEYVSLPPEKPQISEQEDGPIPELERMDLEESKPFEQIISTYNRDYALPYPPICKLGNLHDKPAPHPFFNRKPRSDLESQPGVPYKFLDDHLEPISEGRKKFNFFRQLRNATFELSD